MRLSIYRSVVFLLYFGALFAVLPSRTGASAAEDDLVVHLNTGSVRGGSQKSIFGLNLEYFLGIPYATAPVGDLRFSPPQPAQSWEGVRDGTSYGARCPQNEDSFPRNITVGPMEEDCLFLNVYRATGLKHLKLPVMVWFHGGGLYYGSGNEYLGVLSGHGAIVVTVNYRLGLLGYLNVPGSDIKGNYGMLDQVAALNWVQQNIASFGGIPSMVTIFGQGAGASSIAYHMLSPLSTGLFHKAILQSGAATTPYTFYSSNDPDYGRDIIKRLGCGDSAMLLGCLREKNIQDFLSVSELTRGMLDLGHKYPVVTVDGEFLTDEPAKLLEQGFVNKVSVLLGVNKNDGGIVPMSEIARTLGQEISPKLFSSLVKIARLSASEETDLMKEAILYRYTNHSAADSTTSIEKQWLDLLTDSWFNAPAVHMAKALARASVPVRLYQYNYRTELSLYPEILGVTHGEEIPYVFALAWANHEGTVKMATTYNGVERGLSLTVLELWTNFVKYGYPGISDPRIPTANYINWPAFTTDGEKYLVIDVAEPRVESKLEDDRVVFWEDFLPSLT